MAKKPIEQEFDLAKAIAELPFEGQLELFYSAYWHNNVPAMKALLASTSFDVEHVNRALYNAAMKDHVDMAIELLKIPGINVNWRNKENSNYTPLMRAASNGHAKIVDLLLARNDTDVNARNPDNGTAATLVENDHKDILRKLLDDPRFDREAYQAYMDAQPAIREARNKKIQQQISEANALEARVVPVRKALGLPKPDYGG